MCKCKCNLYVISIYLVYQLQETQATKALGRLDRQLTVPSETLGSSKEIFFFYAPTGNRTCVVYTIYIYIYIFLRFWLKQPTSLKTDQLPEILSSATVLTVFRPIGHYTQAQVKLW